MAAQYQMASDSHGGRPYSGVIRADGRWCACAADNELWDEYVAWVGDYTTNKPDPFLAPAQGGLVIYLQPEEEAVGSMLDSLPDPGAAPSTPPAAQSRPAAPAAQHEGHTASRTTSRTTER